MGPVRLSKWCAPGPTAGADNAGRLKNVGRPPTRARSFQREENTLPAKASTLWTALLAVQQGAPKIQRDAINPHFKNKYISLDSLMPQILPLLNENGLILTQLPTNLGPVEPVPALRTRITHVESGEYIEDIVPLLLDKQNSQGVGSAITYMRRYAVLAILGLVADVDDDGESASQSERKPARTRRQPARPRTAGASGADDDW